ncbi:ABC transporter substrate-binding protein [Nocardioides iriomotensis]|nr:PhnD/SsuA/transferrin family substrate-binding protein [Nocardioides iriomotensis]
MSDQAVVVGSFTPSVVLDLAASTGRLDAAGVVVEEVPVQSSPGQFRSLLDGEIQVALTSPDNVLAYRYNPANPLGELADVRMVAAVDRGMGLGLYGRPGLTIDGLRGAKVGVDVPTSGFALALYALADSVGVGRDDYELVALGSTPQRLRALLAGECDATMLNAGNELAGEAAGCVRLVSATDVCTPYLGVVVAVAGDTHVDVARRISGALVDVAAEIVAGRLTDEAAESAARRLGLDDATALRYVDRLRDPAEGLVPDGVVDPAALRTLVDLRRRYLPVPAADGSGDLLDRAVDDPGLVTAGA